MRPPLRGLMDDPGYDDLIIFVLTSSTLKSMRLYLKLLLLLLAYPFVSQAQTLKGSIRDAKTREALIGATVSVKSGSQGATTNFDGEFVLENVKLPATLIISYVGYVNREVNVSSAAARLDLSLSPNETILKEISVTESRLTEKQRESALTVEAMDIIGIRQTPSANFYDGLGALKGVDVTAASLGFKVINTRGFNSTSPVRTLQIIDGIDNQAPGLNFSLGNFLGASELDVQKVDLIVGASSAFYGPNAFNGVISMTTRSPFFKPGFEISIKTGSRQLLETAMRYAFVVKNKAGEDKLGMKFNAFIMRANDWQADNRAITPQNRSSIPNSLSALTPPGGYDAVNVYGDEYFSSGDFSLVPALRPGIDILYRTGYAEKDIVDYNTRNIKLGSALHYKLTPKAEFIASSNIGLGTTVYQGDNRFSLKDIFFMQNRVELRNPDKYFIRAYHTTEDAGNSYDAYFTALLLQRSVKSDADWVDDYIKYFSDNRYFQAIRNFPGYPKSADYPEFEQYLAAIYPFLLTNFYDSLVKYHNGAEIYANGIGNPTGGNQAFLVPGTAAFDSAFRSITSRESFSQGGSKFFDRSSLYHIHGEYKLNIDSFIITLGGNYRQYLPESRGTIFSDTSGRVIRNSEFGFYTGVDKRLFRDKVKLNATLRIDKNQNFDALFSPAVSGIYSPDRNHTFRVSYSSAIRNPTLTDQYLYYPVGRAILIGNLNGYDSLVTLPSLFDALNYSNPANLDYFNLDPVKPEQVRTIEAGYRSTLFERLFVDMSGYYSTYTNFIGFKLGADVTVAQGSPLPIFLNNIYRISANSADEVTTRGFTMGLNYYFAKFYSVSGNWSWNELDRRGSDDPLIPAFNTPRNKFNLGLSGMDISNRIGNNWGFSINYKWVQGFLFEGSPQFTGEIEDYGLVDVQLNKRFNETRSTFKIGCANVLNNLHYEVYGGPLIGRLFYFQVMLDVN